MQQNSSTKMGLIRYLFNHPLSGGIFLILCTIISLVVANTFFGQSYIDFWEYPLLNHTVSHWINDGLMVIFFLSVGLELKQDLLYGELKNLRSASLPIAAAFGGMIIPAGIYFLINMGDPDTIHGAGIPMATDIAFALAVITLVGARIPLALKVFLTALAVIDDLGAIIVIAIFYTSELHLTNLFISLGVLLFLFILNKSGVKQLIIYLIGGVIAWYFMMNSGIHATISGVLLAFTIPTNEDSSKSISSKLEHAISIPVAFLVLPLFALSNTAITIDASSIEAVKHNYGLGILIGLCIGKPIGITLFSFISCKLKISKLPTNVNWTMIFGAGILAGIGFTMSIFITLLAFDPVQHADYINNAKFIILLSSTIAAIVGFAFLKIVCPKVEKK